MSRPTVLIVDDDQALADGLARMAEEVGFRAVVAYDGLEALRMAVELRPQVLVSDLHLPGLSGETLVREVHAVSVLEKLPVLVVSSDESRAMRVRMLQHGADDFIQKPIDPHEFQIRLTALVEHGEETLTLSVLSAQRDVALRRLNKEAEALERLTMGIVNVLEDTNALNDPNAGNHVRRLAAYSEHGARSFGCKEDFIQVMCRFAGLHDIGKVGLPDALKWKVHTFDENEREQMKEHVTLGHRLLKRATMPLPAQNIALFHHERADGSGYPLGLVGEIIPFEASVVSIADVFDALTTDKPWRSPNHYSFTEAIEIMTGHLRPAFHGSLLKHFFADVKALEAIRERFPDPGI